MWIIEHFDGYNGLQYLAKSLKEQGCKLKFIDLTRGDEYLGSSNTEVIFFGSQQLGETLQKEGKSGLYLGSDNFLFDRYLSCPSILNQGEILNLNTVGHEIDSLWKKYPQGFFIRPNSWKKHFQGQVLTPDNFDKQWSSLKFYIEDEDIEVLVSSLKSIEKEFRILYIKGQAITGSGYQVGREVQEEVLVEPFKPFIESIKSYLPEDTCTIDIALTNEGLKLIEFNPLSTSAIYKSNPELIIKAFS